MCLIPHLDQDFIFLPIFQIFSKTLKDQGPRINRRLILWWNRDISKITKHCRVFIIADFKITT